MGPNLWNDVERPTWGIEFKIPAYMILKVTLRSNSLRNHRITFVDQTMRIRGIPQITARQQYSNTYHIPHEPEDTPLTLTATPEYEIDTGTDRWERSSILQHKPFLIVRDPSSGSVEARFSGETALEPTLARQLEEERTQSWYRGVPKFLFQKAYELLKSEEVRELTWEALKVS